ncbi:MAG: LysM peptidoglycan-binding domain-containing protein [Flavobacteriaceae bacterium]
MKKIICILVFLICGSVLSAQTSYISHRVEKGETITGLTSQYKISEADLFRLNPEIKDGLKENTILIIPKNIESSQKNEVTFKNHKVKRKETLFGIASKYGTNVEEIKKYNKHLYANELKKGEEIRVPIVKVTIVSSAPATATEPGDSDPNIQIHKVEAKETKFGIAQQYGITVAKLEALNPAVYGTDNLPLGMELKVPKKTTTEVVPVEEIDEGYTYYTIQPREGFYRLKVMFDVTEEEVKRLNPHVKDGLKDGMVVKVPKKETTSEIDPEVTPSKQVSLEYQLSNFDTKNLVLFLPFQLDKIQKDSISYNENLLTTNVTMRLALDFYSGVLLATEFAKNKGISVNLHVFDTQEMESGVRQLFQRKNIQDVDLVIGPLRQTQVERVASDLSNQNIPVLSPLSNIQGRMTSNFIHTVTSDNIIENRMLSYLKEHSEGKKLVLLTDNSKPASRQKLQNEFPGIIVVTPREGGFFTTQDINAHIDENQDNWVIIESSNVVVVSSAVGVLNSLSKSRDIRLFTLDNNNAFEYREVSNNHLANLEFTFPSRSKTFNVNKENDFIEAYEVKYGIIPNRFAVRGFDVTYDALLRLAYSDNILQANERIEGETSYVENKFHYVKNSDGGFYNTSTYILKYTKDLDLEEVE